MNVGEDSNTTLAEIFEADIETPQDVAVTNEFQEARCRGHGTLERQAS